MSPAREFVKLFALSSMYAASAALIPTPPPSPLPNACLTCWRLRRSAPGEPCAGVLAELVDHSLVVFGSDAKHRRYGMHETIRVHARGLLCESLRIRHYLGLPRGYPYSFELLAQVNASEERFEHAVQLWAAADTLRARIGAPLEQVNQKENEDALTRLRAQLGDVVFELAWAKGGTMTTEQTIALALS